MSLHKKSEDRVFLDSYKPVKKLPIIRSTKTSRIREQLCHSKLKSNDNAENAFNLIPNKNNRATYRKSTTANKIISYFKPDPKKFQGEGDVELENEFDRNKSEQIDNSLKCFKNWITESGLIFRINKRIQKMKAEDKIDTLYISRLKHQIGITKDRYDKRMENALSEYDKVESIFKELVKMARELDNRNRFLEDKISEIDDTLETKREEFVNAKREILNDIKIAAECSKKIYLATEAVHGSTVTLAGSFLSKIFNKKFKICEPLSLVENSNR